MDLPSVAHLLGPQEIRANFLRMSVYFAIGHGTATTPLVYASSALETRVAYLGNGVLYIVTLISALALSIPLLGVTGLRGGMVVGMALYAVYAAGFSLAAAATTPFTQGLFFVTGSICGGLAAGILWTAQGGYLARTASAVAELDQSRRELITSELATQFAFHYLLFEEVAKILSSLMMGISMSVPAMGLVYTILTAAATYGLSLVSDLKPQASEEKSSFAKLLGAVNLWSDVRIWLLSPTNITFGVSAAYMNGFFNATVASKELGAKNLGYLTAFTVLISWGLTKLYGLFGQRFGNIMPISIGAASFACIPLLLLTIGAGTSLCHDWGWGILVFYALQGSGRSVFESANKAVFADTFKGADTEGAFANCVLQMALAQALCFFMSAVVQGDQLLITVLIFAVLTPVCYIASTHLNRSQVPEAGPLLEKSA